MVPWNSNAASLARVRCALGCAHAARRLYEYACPGDERMRPALAVVSDVVSGGQRGGPSIPTTRMVGALIVLRETCETQDPALERAVAAVTDAVEMALAIVQGQASCSVDQHAYATFVHADAAVRRARAALGADAPGLVAALCGQDTRAFALARALWPNHPIPAPTAAACTTGASPGRTGLLRRPMLNPTFLRALLNPHHGQPILSSQMSSTLPPHPTDYAA